MHILLLFWCTIVQISVQFIKTLPCYSDLLCFGYPDDCTASHNLSALSGYMEGYHLFVSWQVWKTGFHPLTHVARVISLLLQWAEWKTELCSLGLPLQCPVWQGRGVVLFLMFTPTQNRQVWLRSLCLVGSPFPGPLARESRLFLGLFSVCDC